MLQFFSDIDQSQKLLRCQFQRIASSHSSILSTGRELYNLPVESAGLVGARMVDPLEFIQFHISATKQNADVHIDANVMGTFYNQPSFGFNDCESFTTASSTTSFPQK